MDKLSEFIGLYQLYRVKHSPVYALKSAWQIAIKGLPF